MAGVHALYAPSGAGQWVNCPASLTHQAQFPARADTPEAAEGEAAHWYVSETLLGREPALGAVAPNGLPITQEMIDCGAEMVSHVNAICVGAVTRRVEERVYMTCVHPTDCHGTPDVYALNHADHKLYIWDYKYGHGYVSAYRNMQALLYAIGVLESEGIPQDEWHKWHVEIIIAQPRNYHEDGPLRRWSCSGAQLLDMVGMFRAAAVDAGQPDPEYRTGDWCRYCTGALHCRALGQATAGCVDIALQGSFARPIQPGPHALGLEYRILTMAAERIKARLSSLEQEILAQAGQVPHVEIARTNPRERWNTSAETVFLLGDAMGIELRKPAEPITPAQARKAGIDAAVISAYSERPHGSPVVKIDDGSKAARAFGKD